MKRLTLLALVLTACTTQPVKETPEQKPSYPVSGWGSPLLAEIADFAVIEHGDEMVASTPKDAEQWCKGYGKMDKFQRRRFYASLFGALAKFESNYRDTEKYTEDFSDAKGKPVISRGQLQISQESANSYGCGITNPEMLHDPEVNLRCGVRIASKWVVKDGVIQGGGPKAWKGFARYWSPFRKPERIASMKQQLKGICR